MTKLVAQDGQNVLMFQVQECVIQNNTLVLPETEEVGIAVTGTSGTINLEKLSERKIVFARQVFNFFLQFLVFEGLELVEEWLDEIRVDPHENEDQGLAQAPKVQVEPVTCRLHGPNERRDQQGTEKVGEQLTFAEVGDKERHRHLVEAMFFLDNEMGPQREWDAQWLIHPLLNEQPTQSALVLVVWEDTGGVVPKCRCHVEEREYAPGKHNPSFEKAKQTLVLLVCL